MIAKMKEHKVVLIVIIAALLSLLALYIYTENKIIVQNIVEINDYNEVTKEYKYDWISQGYQEKVDDKWKTTESSQRIMEALKTDFSVEYNPLGTYYSYSRVYQKKNNTLYYVMSLEDWKVQKEDKEKEFFTDEYIKVPKLVEKSFFETILDPGESFAMLSYEHFIGDYWPFIGMVTLTIGICWIGFVLDNLVEKREYYTNMIKNFLIIIATIVISSILYYVSMIPVFLYGYNNNNSLPQTDFYVLIGFIIVVAILILSYHIALYERENEYDEEESDEEYFELEEQEG